MATQGPEDVFNSREIMIGKTLHLARTRENKTEEPGGKERGRLDLGGHLI